jgi:hypothetical protein
MYHLAWKAGAIDPDKSTISFPSHNLGSGLGCPIYTLSGCVSRRPAEADTWAR